MYPSACTKCRRRCGWLVISLLSARIEGLEQDWLKVRSVLKYHIDDNFSSLSLAIPSSDLPREKRMSFEGAVLLEST